MKITWDQNKNKNKINNNSNKFEKVKMHISLKHVLEKNKFYYKNHNYITK